MLKHFARKINKCVLLIKIESPDYMRVRFLSLIYRNKMFVVEKKQKNAGHQV